jgi:hypothetical protein
VGVAGLAAAAVGVAGLAAAEDTVVGGVLIMGVATPVTTAPGLGGRTPTPPSHIITPQCTTAPHAIAAWIAWIR